MDPRWLEILKASGWQLGALASALLCFWLLLLLEVLPPIDSPWVTYGLPLATLITGFLSIFALLQHACELITLRCQKRKDVRAKENAIRDEQRGFREYLPFMTNNERVILGHLLTFNQKTFTSSVDGDLASTLLSRGFIRNATRPGQAFAMLDVTFIVPDHIWEVMEEFRSEFPEGEDEVDTPWRKF